jgi:tetratricopeptide (TPR) repeat protein
MSQRRRSRPRAPQQRQRPVTARTNRNQTIYAIIATTMAFVLVATIAGPPLIDYLTTPDQPEPLEVEEFHDPVEAEYQTAVAADPDNAETLAAYGNYLGNTGRVDEAIRWYERALEIDPDNWDIRLGFGRILANGDKRADAELQLKRALEIKPNDPQALFSLGQLYASWVPPRTDEAIAAYQQVIRYGGDSFVVQRAVEELSRLGGATPVAPASPVSTSINVEATP